MPEEAGQTVTIERIENRAIVSLKIAKAAADEAIERLLLAPALRAGGTEPQSLWLGPDHWLLMSTSRSADDLVDLCAERLAGHLHLATDFSAGLTAYRLDGPDVRELLASGCGLDFRPAKYPPGTCCRTRFAQVAVVVVAVDADAFELYVERSYESYLAEWLADSAELVGSCAAGPGRSPYCRSVPA